MTDRELCAAIGAVFPDDDPTPQGLVDAARDPANPLHRLFEWDDAVAAERHRCSVARRLITRYQVVVTVQNKTVDVSYYIRDPGRGAKEAGYVAVQTLPPRSAAATRALLNEMGRVRPALRRALALAEVLTRPGIRQRLARLLQEAQQVSDALAGETPGAEE